MTREDAQKRADRVRAFRDEIQELEREGVAVLPDDLRGRIRAHHDALLERLAGRFDVDRTDSEKQLSQGMRIASFLGAVALSFAVFFFFYRFWGAIPTWAQVALLVAAPILSVVGMEVAARREKTLYFSGIVGLVAVASFGLTLTMLGDIFNIGDSPDAFLAWGLFAGILAYTYGLRLLLLAAVVGVTVFVSGRVGAWGGAYWGNFLERPENLFLSGVALLAIPAAAQHRSLPSFPPLYRVTGLLSLFVPILLLGQIGRLSCLDLPHTTVQTVYQLLGFVAGAIAVGIGVRRRWAETTGLASGFLVVLVYLKFFNWWWQWMPKWLFFLILGAVAVGFLLLLRRLQAATRRSAG
ncbi:MAG: DUF2157 domain-containing protein [Acidobacteriia bacterium]|nr:DUF2157 domain-containing protein [Terriglobia bacterium]